MATNNPFADPRLDAFHGGYIPTPPSPTDFLYPRLLSASRASLARTNHDLRQWNGQSMCMPVGDQKQIGSCAAWTWAYEIRGMLTARWRILNNIQANLNDTMAPRFVYDVGRGPEFLNSYPQDSGMELLTGGAVLLKYGTPPEGDCPYTGRADNGSLTTEITPHMQEAAAFYGISSYFRLQGTGTTLIDSVLQCLDEGYPAGVAILVPESYEQCPSSGRIPVPKPTDTILGGHMVTIVGDFIDNSFEGGGAFIQQGHWGKGWGATNNPDTAGFGYLPFAWFTTTHRQYGAFVQGCCTAR